MAESISLEETNKIRISLGLKPLTDDGPPAESKEQTAEDNYAKRREQETKDRERKRVQDNITKIRNKRELNASLKGKTLADDGEVDDTLKWIKRNKKRAKELAKKQQEELEARDKAALDEYTENDLAGLKVSHDFQALNEGEDRILTLKDSRILDNEEDELQNVELAEDERTKRNNELRLKKRDYTGYDDDEFTPGNEGMKRAILAKYDEDLGSHVSGFRLEGSAPKANRPSGNQKEEEVVKANKSLLSIDYIKNFDTSDYIQVGDIGFKKPKNKKKRPNRRAEVDSEDILPASTDNMDIEEKPIQRRRVVDEDIVDDEDLQAVLAQQRRARLKKIRPQDPEEIARLILEEKEKEQLEKVSTMDIEVGEDSGDKENDGLEFDETSEFVRAIQYNPVAIKQEEVKQEERQISIPPVRTASAQQAVNLERTPMETDDPVYEIEAGEVIVKEEPEDDEAMLDAIEDAIESIEAEEMANGGEIDVGTSSEQTFSSGMASTMAILRQQGILAPAKADQLERERIQRERDLWLADQRRRVAQKDLDRAKTRGSGKDQATREYENRLREQQDARESLDAFKDYKPDINIVYYDEFGRELTPKEAWKALSHRFHGKGSGKMKTEKRLKKIAEEKKKEAMVSGDTPLSMNRAFQIRQERAGQAHMVLSVGNRGAVPQLAEFLDSQPLSKGSKGEKKNKKKKEDQSTPQVVDITSFTALPTNSMPVSASASPIPAATVSETASPAPKTGFSRIVSESPAPVSTSGTPVPANGERTKVAFGLKRKAADEPSNTPPSKKRW